VRQDHRAPFDRALRRAREAAYPAGEYVEQESFMRAGEIRDLAARAGVARGVSVLDLCCGIAGPGRFITRELDCDYLGVDSSASAVEIARDRARGGRCRFTVARVPPLPPGTFEVVLLLETMLAFRDKAPLVAAIADALPAGGRFAFTLEEGAPLTDAERGRMPDADTVWLTPIEDLRALLDRAGLAVRWEEDVSASHRAVADALAGAFAADGAAIAAAIGRRALEDLLSAHSLWSDWLGTGRVRKIAVVAERTAGA
jgi:SAM-dependent methyltransferase